MADKLSVQEARTVDTIVSMLLATQRFAFSLGDAPAEVADLPPEALRSPPADECTQREVRGIRSAKRMKRERGEMARSSARPSAS